MDAPVPYLPLGMAGGILDSGDILLQPQRSSRALVVAPERRQSALFPFLR